MICATTPCQKLSLGCSLPENLEGQHFAVTEGFRCINMSGNTKSIGAHRARGTVLAIDSLNSVVACSLIHLHFSFLFYFLFYFQLLELQKINPDLCDYG